MAKTATRPDRKKASKPAKATGPSKGGDYGLLAKIAWLLIILACGLAMLPFLGFISWLVATPVLTATLVLSIMVMYRGGAIQGGILLALSVVVAPLFIFLAPTLSSTVGMAALMAKFGKSVESDAAPKSKQPSSNTKSADRSRTVSASSSSKRQPTKPQENRSENSRPKVNVLLEKNAPD
ncbi:hypothetical protein ACXR0O_00105 [Verrucomicrobiota bacterium sgz303538]